MGDNPLVFLDTETTGLDPYKHQVWEAAWSIDGGLIDSCVLPHTLDGADPEAMAVNRYHERGIRPGGGEWRRSDRGRLRRALVGATVVGANPAFDTGFLRVALGCAPWHYRLIDVEVMAMSVFRWDRPKSLLSVCTALKAEEFLIRDPNHTAAGDVACTMDVFRALRQMAPPPYRSTHG